MKIVLALEGMDGAGKTSLVHFMKKLCEQQGQPFAQIRRRGSEASPPVAKLSKVLQEEWRNLSAPAEIAARIARELQRADQAAEAPSGLVVLDRFVISLLSLIRIHGRDADWYLPLLREATARAHLHATVFVHCPFELAQGRIKSRQMRPGARENQAELIRRRLAEFLQEDFQRGLLTGQQWIVDNSQTLQVAEDQLVHYLLPFFLKG
jgi:thymidylate kinase